MVRNSRGSYSPFCLITCTPLLCFTCFSIVSITVHDVTSSIPPQLKPRGVPAKKLVASYLAGSTAGRQNIRGTNASFQCRLPPGKGCSLSKETVLNCHRRTRHARGPDRDPRKVAAAVSEYISSHQNVSADFNLPRSIDR